MCTGKNLPHYIVFRAVEGMIEEEHRKWYVIVTRPRAEKKVSACLAKIGIAHFLPLQKQLRQWKDRKKWVEMPLFPSYLFVHIASEFRHGVFEVPGVLKYLSVSGTASTLSASEIDRISRMCLYEKEIHIDQEIFIAGTEVEVIQGPLKGVKGKLVQKASNTYLYMVIEQLGFTASVKIERTMLRNI